jgi:hypothetical protein
MNDSVLNAVLSMDAYNKGYQPGILGLGDLGSKIGNYTLIADSRILEDSNKQRQDEPVGFYGAAYRHTDGHTIISYRGTDDDPRFDVSVSSAYNLSPFFKDSSKPITNLKIDRFSGAGS